MKKSLSLKFEFVSEPLHISVVVLKLSPTESGLGIFRFNQSVQHKLIIHIRLNVFNDKTKSTQTELGFVPGKARISQLPYGERFHFVDEHIWMGEERLVIGKCGSRCEDRSGATGQGLIFVH